MIIITIVTTIIMTYLGVTGLTALVVSSMGYFHVDEFLIEWLYFASWAKIDLRKRMWDKYKDDGK